MAPDKDAYTFIERTRMGIDIMSLLDLIPIDKTLAIVGNGGSLIGNKKGDEIDSFDIVIRFNNYQLGDTYTCDVGSKESIWCTGFCKDVPERPADNIICPLPINIPKHLMRYTSTDIQQYNQQKHRTIFIPEVIYLSLIKLVKIPSIGMCLLYWLSEENYNISSSNVFGFDFFEKSKNHHYFGDHSRAGHSGEAEKRVATGILGN